MRDGTREWGFGSRDDRESEVPTPGSRFPIPDSEAGSYMWLMMASPNAEQDTSVEPAMRRARS